LALGQLGLSQLEAARLLGVKSRTIQRWVAGNPPVGEPAAQALRAWCRLAEHGLAWRPDSDPIDSEDLGAIARRRQLAIGLEGLIRRVASRGGPKKRWRINLKRRRAMAGSISVTFNTLANGGFCPASYRRLDNSTNRAADAELIEEAIVSGELAPGTVLRQEQLSEQFNVSRTPVREALRRLAALGLVSFVPNRGVRVRTISRDELHEAFMVRAELESLATEVAATKITPEELDELDRCEQSFAKISQELRSREPGEERRSIMGDWVRGNHAFHDIIYRVADLPLVEQMAKSARRTFSGPAVWAPGDHSLDGLYLKNAEQHRAIKQALAAGSAAGARAFARNVQSLTAFPQTLAADPEFVREFRFGQRVLVVEHESKRSNRYRPEGRAISPIRSQWRCSAVA